MLWHRFHTGIKENETQTQNMKDNITGRGREKCKCKQRARREQKKKEETFAVGIEGDPGRDGHQMKQREKR